VVKISDYWQAKAVSEREPNQKKQRLLRKEVNHIKQRALANDPITSIDNLNCTGVF
jgi:hypothetical protein